MRRSRGELAQFSLLVAEAAALGDEAALDIFRRAGQELAQIAEALRQKLGYETGEAVKLSYSGGAFNVGDVLLKPFREALAAASPAFELCRPLHDPHLRRRAVCGEALENWTRIESVISSIGVQAPSTSKESTTIDSPLAPLVWYAVPRTCSLSVTCTRPMRLLTSVSARITIAIRVRVCASTATTPNALKSFRSVPGANKEGLADESRNCVMSSSMGF